MDRLAFAVPEALRSVVEEGLARLGYLYPDLDLRFDPASSQIVAKGSGSGTDPQALRKELLYQLYREKIFRDTLPIRRRLYGAP